ncbi:MAG: acylneuraminate cytidylyltransferase family protein [Kiloniellaceae bacterium]
MTRKVPGGPTLALIPAKGCSSRFARKNIRYLGDKPLLAWAADAARDSGVIDRLILSTEDQEVADIAEGYGIEVPFLRPKELANDPAGVSDTALHAIEQLEALGEYYKSLVILLPTCPLRTAEDIQAAYQLFLQKNRPFLMSVSEFNHTPLAALQQSADGTLDPYMPQYFGRKSQEMPAAYRPNGAIHVLDVEAFKRERSYLAEPLVGYVMPRERSIDIDTEEDLRSAELQLSQSLTSSPLVKN